MKNILKNWVLSLFMMIALFGVNLGLNAQAFSYPGTTPGTTTDVSGVPIYVDGTTTTGVYVGHGQNKSVNNVALGKDALMNSTTGTLNTGVGYLSLKSTTSGFSNSAFGYATLQLNTGGVGNTAIGSYALNRLGQDGQSYNSNVAFGFQAGINLVSGASNLFLGTNSASGSTTLVNSNANVGVGTLTLSKLATGSNNIALGSNALELLQYGTNNVGIGYQAAVGTGTAGSPIDNSLSIQNVIFGRNMSSGLAGVIGIGAMPTGTTTGLMPAGTLSKLHIGGTASIPSLQLDVVPNASATSGRKFLFVDEAGVVQQSTVVPGTSFCGTANYIPKVTDAIGGTGCSQLYDNGTNVGIAVGTGPTAKLDIDCANGASLGTIRIRNLQQNPSTIERNFLLIDEDGYLYRSHNDLAKGAGMSSVDMQPVNDKIEKLESEVKALKGMLEMLLKNSNTNPSTKLFSVSPNPSSRLIRISKPVAPTANQYFVELRDLNNQVVIGKRVFSQSLELNLDSRVASGNYLLVFYDQEKMLQTEKVTVIK